MNLPFVPKKCKGKDIAYQVAQTFTCASLDLELYRLDQRGVINYLNYYKSRELSLLQRRNCIEHCG